jgi:ketosteroid isomerase-like protein
MDASTVQKFASDWLVAWNAHGLDAIRSHFSDDDVFTSPLALRIVEGSEGVVRGKEPLRVLK